MTLINFIEYGVTPEDAVNAGRVHLERDSSGFELNYEEADHSEDLLASLESLHTRSTRFPNRNMFFGGVHSVFALQSGLVGVGMRAEAGMLLVLNLQKR